MKKRKLVRDTGWAVVYPSVFDSGYVFLGTVQNTRKDAIASTIGACGKNGWRDLRKDGYRCVRVEIRELP